MTKVSHLTSVHPRYDTRIFIKECTSLANAKYHVYLVVADGYGDEIKNGVYLVDVGAKEGTRLTRMRKTVQKVYKKAIELDSDVYHLHDPELIPIGLKLKNRGKIVIFDAHEDLPKQILSKPYLNHLSQTVLSTFFTFYEQYTCPKFDAIITATPVINNKFLKIHPNSIVINNFPLLKELFSAAKWTHKTNSICYIGGIDVMRGILEVVNAMEVFDSVTLNLAGTFSEKETEYRAKRLKGWSKVNEFGFVSRDKVAEIMGHSKAGIVTFHPLPNHIDAQPNKMFEYLSAGLPIIVSNFPLWREIIDKHQCGIYVNPLDSKAISEAIKWIIDHPKEAENMGKNGRHAVETFYNWEQEEKKLLSLYADLLSVRV